MFGGALPFLPAKASQIISATACLHNVCINARLQLNGAVEDDDVLPVDPHIKLTMEASRFDNASSRRCLPEHLGGLQ